ncbi:MAG TPA: NADPH:quinone oxidoreductase family protein [Thermoleophilaceae bacterium]|jgi:NADPH2:quinone reductase|nr:NADPH:quinone oxidoreductase family protein [Thermoleophilaceae bacterium]
MRGVLIREWGGPEVLELADDLRAPEPGPGQQRICVSVAGVNFADTHARENAYIAKYELPLVPGTEVAGTLDDGTRVVAMPHHGGYAEYAIADEQSIFPLPNGLGDHAALALLIQGLTAWHLYRTAAQIRAGETAVVHSAAGGTGSLAVQLAKPMGAARVIGSASSEEKRALVAELGADAVIDSAPGDMAERLLEANEGKPVDVVFDMAGGAVFGESAEALAPFGRIVVYGIASREQNDLRTGRLMRKSRGVIGFWLMHCLERPETMMREPLRDLFERAARGELKPQLGNVYPLSEVRRAHEDLVGRRTTGKLVLDPRR